MDAYLQLVEEAVRLNVMELYKNDLLVHDKAILLRDDAPKHFLWTIGPCGTHLVDSRCEHAGDYVQVLVANVIPYLYRDSELTAVSRDQAKKWLLRPVAPDANESD